MHVTSRSKHTGFYIYLNGYSRDRELNAVEMKRVGLFTDYGKICAYNRLVYNTGEYNQYLLEMALANGIIYNVVLVNGVYIRHGEIKPNNVPDCYRFIHETSSYGIQGDLEIPKEHALMLQYADDVYIHPEGHITVNDIPMFYMKDVHDMKFEYDYNSLNQLFAKIKPSTIDQLVDGVKRVMCPRVAGHLQGGILVSNMHFPIKWFDQHTELDKTKQSGYYFDAAAQKTTFYCKNSFACVEVEVIQSPYPFYNIKYEHAVPTTDVRVYANHTNFAVICKEEIGDVRYAKVIKFLMTRKMPENYYIQSANALALMHYHGLKGELATYTIRDALDEEVQTNILEQFKPCMAEIISTHHAPHSRKHLRVRTLS